MNAPLSGAAISSVPHRRGGFTSCFRPGADKRAQGPVDGDRRINPAEDARRADLGEAGDPACAAATFINIAAVSSAGVGAVPPCRRWSTR